MGTPPRIRDLLSDDRRSTVLGRTVLWALAYVLAAQAASYSRLPDTEYALIWPSAGVAALWLLFATRRTIRYDVAGLVLAAVASSAISGGPPGLLLARTGANLALGLSFRFLVDRWTGLRRRDGGLCRLTTIGSFVGIAAAALVSGLLQAGINQVPDLLLGDAEWVAMWNRTVRNSIAAFTLVVTGLLLWGVVHPEAPSDDPADAGSYGTDRVHSRNAARGFELAALVAFSAGVIWFSFVLFPDLPTAFALFLPSAWAGLRLAPPSAALYGLAVGVLAVGLTLGGVGMFAAIDGRAEEAFVAQGFLGVVFATTVTLSFVRTELAAARVGAVSRNALLDNVLSSVTDGIVLVSEQERLLLANRAARELLQLDPDLEGVRWTYVARALLDDDGRPLTRHEYPQRRALAGDMVLEEDLRVRFEESGDERILRTSAHVLPAQADEPRLALVTFRDVTAERAREAELTAFAGVVAHDLKNPLTVVEGWGEVLEQEFLDVEALPSIEGLPLVRRVNGAAVHMRGLIDELLSYALARDSVLRPEPVDLDDLVEQVAEGHRVGALREPESWPLITVDCPHEVWADPVLLRQLVDNLVGNAVKYVAPGVRPRVCVEARELPDGEVLVSVTDNGLGVPVAERARVFESFYRVDHPGYQGTGLGLAICQRIARRHGGILRITDGPDGVGSTFSFTLPTATRHGPGAPGSGDLPGHRP